MKLYLHSTLKLILAAVALSCLIPAKAVDNRPYRPLAFAWGAELITNVDLSQHNMSAVGINAKMGFRWKWIRFFGIGAEGDFMVSNSDRSYPLFINFKTDFSNRSQLLFMDLRGGVSLNYLNNNKQKTGAYASAGIGVTLAKGKNFSSYISLAYTYVGQDVCYVGERARKCPGVSMATLRLGAAFQVAKKIPENHQVIAASRPEPVKIAQSVKATPRKATHSRTKVPFVNYKKNSIVLPPDADKEAWKKLAADVATAQATNGHIDIMHIGDSHIQAEMGTSRTREILQETYGNGGRGLLTAFRLAGTNQPVDYEITAALPVSRQARLLKRPWDVTPGFTGVASSTDSLGNRITYSVKNESAAFDRVRIFTSEGERYRAFPQPVVTGEFIAFPDEKVYGIYTSNSENAGIVYSTVGNNGACYGDYLLLDGFAGKIAQFSPRLIILSMGTNEGFSSMSNEEIAESAHTLIKELREANPGALFLLTTPMECHKKDADGVFQVNQRVKDVRDIIMCVGASEQIPVWDFYEVAGGDGIANKWIENDLMNPRDHVHLLNNGYAVMGELQADALIDLFNRLLK